ncbi:MAG: STAS domain-containing protein [Clostridia bacterium]
MEMTSKIENGTMTLYAIGNLDSIGAPLLRDYLIQYETADFKKLVIDFTDVQNISSAGLRVLLSTQKQEILNNRTIEIININADIHGIFKLTGLCEIMNVK